jgi:hypothetical protein
VRLGEELRLELDPRLASWMGLWLRDGDLGRARVYALQPVWRGLEIESRGLFGPKLSSSSVDAAPVPMFRPVARTPIPLCPTSKPPKPPEPPKPGEEPPQAKAGDVKDVLDAVSKTEAYQCTVVRLFDSVERNAQRDWKRLSTTERVTVVTAGGVIAAGAVAGLLSNQEGRRLALDQILGADVPVPWVRGLSFKILRDDPPAAPPVPPDKPAPEALPRPVGLFFTLDVPSFLQNFQRLPTFKVGH